MKYILLAVFFITPWILVADDSAVYPTMALESPISPLQAIVKESAKRHGVNYITMSKIIKCESGWNPKAHNGKGENSWGLVQINLDAHTDISVKQATNPQFASDFLAKELARGNGRIWTCYR